MKQREKLWTPGPWYAIDNGHYFDISTADNQYGSCVADVCSSKYLPGGNDEEANAQLISAAPDLVEALENLMDIESRDRVMPIGPEWDAARAALSKAYGDSQ